MPTRTAYILLLAVYFFSSCSPGHKISRSANARLIKAAGLGTAHIGISIYEPATERYWFDYQGDHYFVPASNTKIPTCYAAMKYLGDSLVGLRIGIPEEPLFKEDLFIQPTGDPSFLHRDFPAHPAFDFLKQKISSEKRQPFFMLDTMPVERWGNGWSWNDYESAYMAERSSFPIFGNTVTIGLRDGSDRFVLPAGSSQVLARPFFTGSRYFDSVVNGSFSFAPNDSLLNREARALNNELHKADPAISMGRAIDKNQFIIQPGALPFKTSEFPFVTNGPCTAVNILEDSLSRRFSFFFPTRKSQIYELECKVCPVSSVTIKQWQKIHSQPTDSVLKLMMHRSDNFFAEQSLLMVAKEYTGQMNERRIIDTLLRTDFSGLPQKPRWVDGSGLSRYNLFSPRDLVMILDKMRTSFGMDRLKNIFATGNEGTLTNYYKSSTGWIFAKTGTLSGVVAISGYLYSKQNRLFIFSVLVNNHQTSATDVRRAVEKFIEGVREGY